MVKADVAWSWKHDLVLCPF